jgi:hypothetical protein
LFTGFSPILFYCRLLQLTDRKEKQKGETKIQTKRTENRKQKETEESRSSDNNTTNKELPINNYMNI